MSVPGDGKPLRLVPPAMAIFPSTEDAVPPLSDPYASKLTLFAYPSVMFGQNTKKS